ncbi:hypothetical protein PG997_014688 [Apiospora hydei]|uniref:Uncharacterized protein n=1 Tax=Apiospora hydei TaxID=1337664 RepID=A0ABR1UUJ7_9PEZI
MRNDTCQIRSDAVSYDAGMRQYGFGFDLRRDGPYEYASKPVDNSLNHSLVESDIAVSDPGVPIGYAGSDHRQQPELSFTRAIGHRYNSSNCLRWRTSRLRAGRDAEVSSEREPVEAPPAETQCTPLIFHKEAPDTAEDESPVLPRCHLG